MFCGKIANEIVDRVHKQAFRILRDDQESTFEALLAKNDETNIHTQYLRVLMIKIYKTLNNTNPPFMQEYLIRKGVKYDLRTRDLLQIPAASGKAIPIQLKERHQLLNLKRALEIGMERNVTVKYVDNAS